MAIQGVHSRVTGLFSGMDTADLVRNMIQFERAKVDRQVQLKTKLEWKRDAFRDVTSALRTFRDQFMNPLNPKSNLFSSSAYSSFKVNMLHDTHAVAISAGSKALDGRMTLDEIRYLAEEAAVQSENIFESGPITADTPLSELALANQLRFDDDNTLEFTINGVTFTVSQDDTLSSLMNQVNNSEAGVRMTVSSLSKGMTIQSKTTGASSRVVIENHKGNAFAGAGSAFGIQEGTYAGRNAELVINGYEVVQENNRFSIDGITYTLKDTTDQALSFVVERDTDETFERIKGFVTAYNELVDNMQGRLSEKAYPSFPPLTDEERSGLSDGDIKLWEDKAKSGLLKNDPQLTRLMEQLRTAFFTPVASLDKSAAQLGLTTGSWRDRGKIILDEDVLRKALEHAPDEVAAVFTRLPEPGATDAFRQSGLMVRLSDAMGQYTAQVTSSSLSALDRNINDASDRLKKLERALFIAEEQHWKKLAAMERALSALNSQSSWLSSQIMSLG